MLDDCYKLVELPSDFGNLVNLRHLSLGECSVSIPPRIGRLTSLQKLAHFKVGKEIGHGINELKDMIQLQGSLCISELQNVVNVKEAKEGFGEEVLKCLQPHPNLQEVDIEGYWGIRFPTWLGDSSFSNLVSIELIYTEFWQCALMYSSLNLTYFTQGKLVLMD
ncbi:hypothetical protein MRB53_001717 [Persea americana]|uniref:Uncharacterized protein n=1 Tax=Persea americana TaxID=3435 RepID=A0ACC2MSN7_PERAE|nr:hypothetical protein MRB53_001717 [Persea americana]